MAAILVLLAVPLFQEAPASGDKPVRLPESYAHPFYAFKIRLPPKWQRGEGRGMEKISFYGPKDGIFIPRIDMSIEPASGDLGDYLVKFHAAFEKAYSDVSILRIGPVEGRSGTGRIFVGQIDSGGIPTVSMWAFFVAEGRRFSLGFSVSRHWSERYLPMVEAAMCSLRIHPVPKASLEEQKAFQEAYSAGEDAYRRGRFDAALHSFRKCINLLPGYAETHAAMGTTLMRQLNHAGAEEAFRKALELDPDDYTFNFNLGVCALKQEKFPAAIAALEKAVAADPGSEPALTNLGVALIGDDRDGRAVNVLLRAVEADPESPTAHYNLGMAYENLGRAGEAAAEYREALKVDPDHQGARDGLVRVGK